MTSASQKLSQPTEDILIKALRSLEKDWPKNYWLFAASGALTPIKKKNGVRVIGQRTGGMDPGQTVETFLGIECDGGDW